MASPPPIKLEVLHMKPVTQLASMPQCTKEPRNEFHVLLKTASRAHLTACLPNTRFLLFFTRKQNRGSRADVEEEGCRVPPKPKMRGYLPNSVLAACPRNTDALTPGGPRHSSDHRHPLRSARPGIGAEGSGVPRPGCQAQPATPGAVLAAALAAG